MCLILQRAAALIPIVIMGESGVGKTALIKYLVKDVLEDHLNIINIHAGIDETRLIE